MIANIIAELKSLGEERIRKNFAHFGVEARNSFGVSTPFIRNIAKRYKNNHELALELWESPYHEAKILASFIADPGKFRPSEMKKWCNEFYSWDICDAVCKPFALSNYGLVLAKEWCCAEKEFVKRAGFVTMTNYTIHKKNKPNEDYMEFFSFIKSEAWDDRNFVKKAVNWLLRQIGKKNLYLNKKAIEFAKEINDQPYKSAKWIAKDALRELTGEMVQKRLSER